MRSTLLLSLLVALVALPILGPKSSNPKVDVSTTSPAGVVSSCEFGQPTFGASCENDNGNVGVLAGLSGGAFGAHPDGNYGILGSQFNGVYGASPFGPFGFLGDANYGAWGEHGDGSYGVLGSSHTGAYGISDFGGRGFIGTQLSGVSGDYISGSTVITIGELANLDVGAYGSHGFSNDNRGSLGGSFYGARGWNANDNRGYLGHDSYGVWGFGSPWAGYFDGNVHVVGTLSKGGGSFKIDHPLDPEGQYLSHSFVESPDMMNVYNGNTTTDAQGLATVTLPDYFEALNRDYRYQLTVIGQFAQAIVAEEIQANRFVIRTDAPNVKVSWQVTGIRQDAWAEAHRVVVEEAKPAEERGYYLHPGLYGQPEVRSVAWVRDPEGMRAVEEMPARQEAQRRRMEQQRKRIDEDRERMQQARERMQQVRPGQ